MSRQRNQEIDLLKGFGILLMVFDHVGWGQAVHTYIQSFHMPLFFIVSGYLWKTDQTVYEVTQKRAKTILVPYAVFSTLYLLILAAAILSEKMQESWIPALKAVLFFPTDMVNMPFAPALWFLPCFFFSNVLFAFLENKVGKKKWIWIMVLAVAGMTYSSLTDTMLPFALETIPTALTFLLTGELIRKYEGTVFRRLDKMWVIVALLVIETVLAFINGSVDMRSARYHNCLLYIANSLLGTLAWWGMIRQHLITLPKCRVGGLQYLSINSIAFLCLNQFIIFHGKNIMGWFVQDSILARCLGRGLLFVFTLAVIAMINEFICRTKLRIVFGRYN